MNLQAHLNRYCELLSQADDLYKAVYEKHGDLINCKPGCDQCCSVYYQISLIEAFYINGIAKRLLTPEQLERAITKAGAGEKVFREAKSYLESLKVNQAALEEAAAKLVIPCPLLEDHGCVLYDHRPVTCRLYGLPQQIGSRVISCPLNNFEKGENYNTVFIDKIQKLVAKYSKEFLQDMIGRNPSRPILFSISGALLTSFDKKFFIQLKAAIR